MLVNVRFRSGIFDFKSKWPIFTPQGAVCNWCSLDHRGKIFTIDFCENHCQKKVMPLLSCELKNGKSNMINRYQKSHMSRLVRESDFIRKYEAGVGDTTRCSKIGKKVPPVLKKKLRI